MEKSRPSRKDSVDLVSKIETETCKCFSFRTLVCGALLWVLSFNVATVSYATYLLIAKENKDQNAEGAWVDGCESSLDSLDIIKNNNFQIRNWSTRL